MTNVKECKAYLYAKKSIRLKTTPKYVKLQMKEFIKIADGKDNKYFVNEKILNKLELILKLLNMPKGLKVGQSLYDCSTGYQWLFYTAILCTCYRDNYSKRRYEIGLLEICRKNFKTYTIATILIVLFLTEPNFSKFFSVAPDGTLSREVREAIAETIRSSPAIYEFKNQKRFKILRDYIMFIPKQTKYIPLNYSTSRLDGRLPNVFCADEVGALPVSYAIEAMRSGQLNILNKLGFIISTKYPTIDNPFEDWVKYSKQVLDKLIKDDKIFALLYEPDDTKDWMTNDLILKQSNPVALEMKEIWNDLLNKRATAIAMESARQNFLTKHCNIIYQGIGTETYIDVADVQKCKVKSIDWSGKIVYLHLDLSQSGDNTAVAMSAYENDIIYSEVVDFIPEDRIDEKNKTEHIDYREFIRAAKCIACGGKVINYKVVEDYVLNIEKRYNVKIQMIGFDIWNALSTAQKLEDAGYILVEIKQHSSVLHSATKFLKEKILSGEFAYTENKLLEINFQNARCTYDNNLNMYVSKLKSNGKVDMVVAIINTVHLILENEVYNTCDWVAQVI